MLTLEQPFPFRCAWHRSRFVVWVFKPVQWTTQTNTYLNKTSWLGCCWALSPLLRWQDRWWCIVGRSHIWVRSGRNQRRCSASCAVYWHRCTIMLLWPLYNSWLLQLLRLLVFNLLGQYGNIPEGRMRKWWKWPVCTNQAWASMCRMLVTGLTKPVSLCCPPRKHRPHTDIQP